MAASYSQLESVWKEYLEFESFTREKGGDLHEFIDEWHRKLESAQLAGCHYSDLVLAYKLMEKARLDEKVVATILSLVDTPVSEEKDMLSDIVDKVKLYWVYLRRKRERQRRPKTVPEVSRVSYRLASSHPQEYVTVADDAGSAGTTTGDEMSQYDALEEYNENDDGHHRDQEHWETLISSEGDDSSRPPDYHQEGGRSGDHHISEAVKSRLKKMMPRCPRCTSTLCPRSDSMSTRLVNDIFMCRTCKRLVFAHNTSASITGSEPRITWKCWVLPRCPACPPEAKPRIYFQPSFDATKTGRLCCHNCGSVVLRFTNDFKPSTAPKPREGGNFSEEDNEESGSRMSQFKLLFGESNSTTSDVKSAGDDTYPCEICGKHFKQMASLTAHTQTHNPVKNFKCEHCPKRFRTVSQLNVHNKIHTEKDSFICSYCGKNFTRYGLLYMHINIHTKARTYDCTDCEAKFVHYTSYLIHKRVNHTGEFPYKCDICGKSFPVSGKLRIHRRVHSDTKTLSCKFCEKTYKHPSSLSKHLKLHT